MYDPMTIPGEFVLARWPTGVVIRQFTEEAVKRRELGGWSDWLAIEQGEFLQYAWIPRGPGLLLRPRYIKLESFSSMDRAPEHRTVDIYGARQGELCWFYLDLVGVEYAASGGLNLSIYEDGLAPLLVQGDFLASLDRPEVQELEHRTTRELAIEASRALASHKIAREDFIPLHMPSLGEIEHASLGEIEHEFSLIYTNFNPKDWSLNEARFENELGPMWIVVSDNDRVVGVGLTPLMALFSVPFFVWPVGYKPKVNPRGLTVPRTLEDWLAQNAPPPSEIPAALETYHLLGIQIAALPMDEFAPLAVSLRQESP